MLIAMPEFTVYIWKVVSWTELIKGKGCKVNRISVIFFISKSIKNNKVHPLNCDQHLRKKEQR